MRIKFESGKQIVNRNNLKSGDVFYYNEGVYMAIDIIGQYDEGYTYDSVNLMNGVACYLGDELVYLIDYDFIIK